MLMLMLMPMPMPMPCRWLSLPTMPTDAGAVVRVGAILDKALAWMCRVLLFGDDQDSLLNPSGTRRQAADDGRARLTIPWSARND
jgi:hypothetical protein